MICPPDKGNAVVLLDRCDYVRKMLHILNDSSKFSSDPSDKDRTAHLEKEVSSQLNALVSKGFISAETARNLTPRGSSIPRLYGLPKTHKSDVPLRPILSMVSSPTHKLAQWLASLLEPLCASLCDTTVSDSFDFVDRIKDSDLHDSYMCSFDVVSLFTNLPLEETIDIIGLVSADLHLDFPLPLPDLKSLLLLCTKNVQFSFNEKLFRQTDGVAMGSPLGPILANIFLGYVEKYCLNHSFHSAPYKPIQFFRFVDDTFALFSSPQCAEHFLSDLNTAHSNLTFTQESENNGSLSFLDVRVTRGVNCKTLTSVYRKPTWSVLYLHFLSFAPIQYKKGIVRTLFDRSRKICSPECLNQEIEFLTKTLAENGYPVAFIKQHSKERVKSLNNGPECKPVYIRLPFPGDPAADRLHRMLRNRTKAAYPAADPRIIFETQAIGVRSLKDSVPLGRRSHIIYEFKCKCSSTYVGRTERCLSSRVSEHLPCWVFTQKKRGHLSSAITRHVVSCSIFDRNAPPLSYFSILTQCSFSFKLRILEALFIIDRKPPLCVQKDFVYGTKLRW